MAFKRFLYFFVNFLWLLLRIDLSSLSHAIVKVNDRHSAFLESSESLLCSLNIVIISPILSGSLASLHESIEHGLFAAVHEQHELDINSVSHHINPAFLIVLVPWEPIDEELLGGPTVLFHSLFDEVDGDLDWHDIACNYNRVYELSLLAATVSFRSEKITGGKMNKSVISDEVCTLSALARPRTSKWNVI